MATSSVRRLQPVLLKNVSVEGPFWAPRQKTNREATLQIEYQQLVETGRIDAWKLDWKPGDPIKPHYFWDSDVAKWIEAAAYSLANHPDDALESEVDAVVDLIESAQQDDGYLNIYFTAVEPENRWKNLRDWHELYCAGHLMEAAVAYYEAKGKRKLLDVLCRYADYIDSVFGNGPGQMRGYPGHEEIELALVKLYRATGEQRYLDLARFFVDERGRQPHYFDLESDARNDGLPYHATGNDYTQSHLPIREQTTIEGHSVRAGYLYSGVADVAALTGDDELLAAVERLWRNTVERRMYITGGIGSRAHGERFSYDYDLRNDIAYAETCAAISLVFWAHRMLQVDGDRRYADVMERALYNGVLSGISLDGRCFFYGNPLEVLPDDMAKREDLYHAPAQSAVRQEWFGCACCPPNIARLLASLGEYVYSVSVSGDDVPTIYTHLYVGGVAQVVVDGAAIQLTQTTNYPWDGAIELTVGAEEPVEFALALRVPGWCRDARLKVNGQSVDIAASIELGYAVVHRLWSPGDRVQLDLAMPVERMQAHPKVRADIGRVALMRGPLVYCLEEIDNGAELNALSLPFDAEPHTECWRQEMGGVVVVRGKGYRRVATDWGDDLYRPADVDRQVCEWTAVPYYAWGNRTPGEMIVWIREA